MSNGLALLAAFKDHGVDVKTVNGWDNYGWWNNRCRGVLLHHTATASASVTNPAPTLSWCLNAYDKPVANMLVGKTPGHTYLLASGPAYHCGQGGPWDFAGIPAGNRPDMLFGVEIDDPGAYGKNTLTDYQVANSGKISAALYDFFGWTDERSIGTHKCWTDLCHTGASKPGKNLGRKNDTHDGQWREFPGSNIAQPYNAPYWRALADRYRHEDSGTWDGTIPFRSTAKAAQDQGTANKAAWRLACRLYDLGYKNKPAAKNGKQTYPTSSVKAFRVAQGWPAGQGAPSRAAWRRIFGADKP